MRIDDDFSRENESGRIFKCNEIVFVFLRRKPINKKYIIPASIITNARVIIIVTLNILTRD